MEMINLLKKLNELSTKKTNVLVEQEGRKMPLPGLSDYEKDWGGTDPHDSSGLDPIATAVGWKETPKEEVGIKAKVYFPKIMSFDVKSRYETGRKGLERRISVEKLKQDDLDQWYYPVPADMKPADLKNHVKYLERYFGPKGDIVKATSDDTPGMSSDDRSDKISNITPTEAPDNVVQMRPKSGGMMGGGDHKTTHYDQAIDFYGMFEADELDKEEMDQENGVFRGYKEDENGKMKLVAYFKFDNPENIDDEDPGEGWFEGEDGSSILDTPRGMREDSDLALLRKLAGLKESFPAMGGVGTANMNISAANGKELAGIIKDIVGGSDTSNEIDDEPALSAKPGPASTMKTTPSMRDMIGIFDHGSEHDDASEPHSELEDENSDEFLEDDMDMYDSTPRPRVKQDPVRQFGDIDNNHQNGLVGHNVRETTEEDLYNDYRKFVSEATKNCCCKESGKTKCPVHSKKVTTEATKKCSCKESSDDKCPVHSKKKVKK